MADLGPFLVALDDEDYVEKFAALLVYLEPRLTEVEAGRQGQADLAANFARYILASAGLQGALQANGFKITGAADASADSDYVTLRQLVATAFAPALPGQAGNARKVIRTDGTSASWGWPIEWDTVAVDSSAAPGQALAVRTNAASLLISLPDPASDADPVFVKDADFNAATYPIRIDPGSEAFEDGAAGEILEITEPGGCAGFQFINSKWRIVL